MQTALQLKKYNIMQILVRTNGHTTRIDVRTIPLNAPVEPKIKDNFVINGIKWY